MSLKMQFVYLHKASFTRQGLKMCALQRNDDICEQFASDMTLYNLLNEVGTDHRNTLRAKGYSLRGRPALKQKLLVRVEHISTMCIVC